MQTKEYALGIDTSNYKTSVAVINKDGRVIHDLRKPLTVKQGERGLRQSYALFQHIEALPALIGEAIGASGQEFGVVAASSKPRPVASSYMPVFKAGENIAEVVAHALGIPIFKFSHQEGHIEAVKNTGSLREKENFLCYHLSGGTCELLKINGQNIDVIGGTKDISFGQVLDRVGVLLGMSFPCGEELDGIALKPGKESDFLTDIPLDGLYINLSGIETQASKTIKQGLDIPARDAMIKELLNKICKSLIKLTEKAVNETKLHDVLLVGGVASSAFLYNSLHGYFGNSDINIDFGDQRFASDNAIGTALLGGEKIWL